MTNFKVSEIIDYIRGIFVKDFILTKVKIGGEISNLKFHHSGHIYLSLKDENARIDGVIYKWNITENIQELRDGDYVVATGSVNLNKDSRISYTIEKVDKNGLGKLYEDFLELKKELEEKGYFKAEHKKKLPMFPKKIGIITSPKGAAVRDLIDVIQRRNINTNIIIYPALVQGASSLETLISGLDYLESTDVDVVIIGRGGGSYEDLNSFNSKQLALRIYDYSKPIISAVGHEVDFVISDFVADVRAATPSVAGELAVSSLEDFKENVKQKLNRIEAVMNYNLNLKQLDLSNLKLRLSNVSLYNKVKSILHENRSRLINTRFKMELSVDVKLRELYLLNKRLSVDKYLSNVDTELNRLSKLKLQMDSIIRYQLDVKTEELNSIKIDISKLDINKMLDEGYAIVSDVNNIVIKDVNNTNVGDKLNILLSNGELQVQILDRKVNK